MSVQVSDYVFYENKKFILIDIEKDKQLVDFIKPSFFQGIFSKIFKKKEYSSCWRGYIAEYFIENDGLYGIKYNISLRSDEFKGLKSKKRFIDYTGSIIVASNEDDKKWYNSDFLNSYLHFDNAYEIYFKNGVVKSVNDLSVAILEYRNKYKENETQEINDIAKKYLKYEYDRKTYKWR